MADPVVLLHGIGRSPLSLSYAGRKLRAAGFEPIAIRLSVAAPSDRRSGGLRRRAAARRARPAAAFPHPLDGAIVLRCLVATRRPPNLGRAVMLGPPNGGSRLAGRMRDRWLYRALMGPAGQELAAGPRCRPLSLGAVDFEVGVIAGNRSLDPFRLLVRRRQRR